MPTRAGFPETDGSARSTRGAGASPWPHLGSAGEEVSLPGWTPSTGARVLLGTRPSWWPWPRVSPSSQRPGVPASPMALCTQAPGDQTTGQLPSTSNLLPRNSRVEIPWSRSWPPSGSQVWRGAGVCFSLGPSLLHPAPGRTCRPSASHPPWTIDVTGSVYAFQLN